MLPKNLKIFIIAGEVSGDVLGAKIMRELPDVTFVGIGGENMQAAGLKTLFPISDLSVMGIIEVLARAKTLTGRIRQTVDAILKERPDIILTVDSPSFAKRVIKKVRESKDGRALIAEKSLKFNHVVAPQVWAWGAKRAKKFAQIFDKLYAFFDFEKPYFTKYGLDTTAVGHPIAEGLSDYTKTHMGPPEKIITLVPGSRMSEVKKLLPIFKETVEQLQVLGLASEYKFVIPTVETTRDYISQEIQHWSLRPTLVPGTDRYDLYARTYIAVVASGTVSAELAIMHIPAIVVYKMSPLTTVLAHFLVKVKWVSLVNILLNKSVYPELLGSAASAKNIVPQIERLSTAVARKKMISDLAAADKMWRRSENASRLIADDIRKSA